MDGVDMVARYNIWNCQGKGNAVSDLFYYTLSSLPNPSVYNFCRNKYSFIFNRVPQHYVPAILVLGIFLFLKPFRHASPFPFPHPLFPSLDRIDETYSP